MACWRVLELSESSDSQHVPQLLIKPEFTADSYTIFLTDLSSIWSEELDLDAILERASRQKSPIEVSKRDTSQLGILLDNVRKTLSSAKDASCHLTRVGTDDLALHTSVNLPEPLDSLTWKFNLAKKTSLTLKNELIVPLLVSSHIQHSRLRSLTALIDERDKAIARLVDQFEASSLDLATAFPSVGGSKAGRRPVKREQAAKQIPALRPFDEDVWKAKTGKIQDVELSCFGLFQDALAECTAQVPSHLAANKDRNEWWTNLSKSFQIQKHVAKYTEVQKGLRVKSPTPQAPSDDETSDEFETHVDFYQREASKKLYGTSPPPKAAPQAERAPMATDDDTTEDEDLDALPSSQSQKQPPQSASKHATRAKSPETKGSPSPEPTAAATRKAKGFRIGGAKSKAPVKIATPPVKEDEPAERNDKEPEPTQVRKDSAPSATPTKARKPFRIGGKTKSNPRSENEGSDTSGLPERNKSEDIATHAQASPKKDRSSRDTATRGMELSKSALEEEVAAEEHEETAEEKAERRRRELKRKNEEELAKKQAQKKKKRF